MICCPWHEWRNPHNLLKEWTHTWGPAWSECNSKGSTVLSWNSTFGHITFQTMHQTKRTCLQQYMDKKIHKIIHKSRIMRDTCQANSAIKWRYFKSYQEAGANTDPGVRNKISSDTGWIFLSTAQGGKKLVLTSYKKPKKIKKKFVLINVWKDSSQDWE